MYDSFKLAQYCCQQLFSLVRWLPKTSNGVSLAKHFTGLSQATALRDVLSNDPGKNGSNFFCCGAIRFPHIEMFSFLRRECINLQKGSLRKKMNLNSTFKECIFVLKHFGQSQELQTIAKKCLQFYMIRTYTISVLLRLRRDFVIRKLNRKKGINIHAALPRFRKIWCLNHSRDNSKVSNFLHSHVFAAFWSFPSYPDHYLILNQNHSRPQCHSA